MKEIVNNFLEKGYLLSPDFVSGIDEFFNEEDFMTSLDVKTNGEKPLILNKEIKNVIQTYGHKVNYIFVDAEQKLQKSQNTIFSLKSKIPNTNFFSFKNNDLTAESADLMIDQLFDQQLEEVYHLWDFVSNC